MLELAIVETATSEIVANALVEDVDVVEFEDCELVLGEILDVVLKTAEEEVVVAFSPN